MELICTADGDVPLWMRIGDGNESDQKRFAQSMKEFKKQFNLDSLIVTDSALYSQENLQALKNIKWLSRVPLKIKAAHNLVLDADSEKFTPSKIAGYSYLEVPKTYGGIRQRKLLKKSKYHELTSIKVQEFKDKSEANVSYIVVGQVTVIEAKVQPDKSQAGRFILATNVLDEAELTAEEMLSKYKDQQSVERGFRFFKDPYFLTDSVFLKSPQRIEALGLIMGLCLLVYTLGQRQLRQTLKLMRFFGTDKPTHEIVSVIISREQNKEAADELWQSIERGTAKHIFIYDGDIIREIFFIGLSFD